MVFPLEITLWSQSWWRLSILIAFLSWFFLFTDFCADYEFCSFNPIIQKYEWDKYQGIIFCSIFRRPLRLRVQSLCILKILKHSLLVIITDKNIKHYFSHKFVLYGHNLNLPNFMLPNLTLYSDEFHFFIHFHIITSDDSDVRNLIKIEAQVIIVIMRKIIMIDDT